MATRTTLLLALLWPFHALAILPLAAVGAGVAAAGLIGGLLSNKKAKTFQPIKYDKVEAPYQSLYQYGGTPDYANQMRSRLMADGANAAGRNVLRNTSQADYRAGIADYRAGLAAQTQARGQQQQLASQLFAASQGQGPSVAQEQQKAGTEAAALNALNIAATSRGGGAGATISALDSNALAAQRANRDAATLRAQEINDARAQLAGVTDSIRQGDQAAIAAAQGYSRLGLEQQQIGQQQQSLALQQMQQNDALRQALLEAELNVNNAQLQGSMGYGAAALQAAQANQAAQLQAGLAAQGLNANAYESWQQRNNALWGGLISGGGAAGAAALGK